MKILNQHGINYLFIAALLLVSLSSCNKWLDVHPSTQTTEEQQFSSEQGYIDALIGTYQKMASSDSYGKELTFGAVDVLAQSYQNKASQMMDAYGELARYNYTESKNNELIARIWSTQYGIIAQTNYILKDIDSNKKLFQGQNYNLIKGEALAIRALVHFDLLRLFAPSKLDMQDAAKSTIPYMTSFSVDPSKSLPFAEVTKAILVDLQQAAELLAIHKGIDQIQGNRDNTSLELFHSFRQNHLNYWAVKSLLARLNLYIDDKPEALRHAKEVIESEKFFFINAATVNTNPTLETSNASFSTEHVFSIYKSDLKTISDRFFKTESNAPESEDLFTSMANLNNYYEITLAGHGIDIRGPQASSSRWSSFNTATVYSTKYYVGTNVRNVNQKLIPVVRLAELYYIAAEAAEGITEALGYLNKVRQARLIPALSPTVITNSSLLEKEIFKEYRKEFYAEGQLWYYYKRKNYTVLGNSVGGSMNTEKYVFPLPNAEIEFGLN